MNSDHGKKHIPFNIFYAFEKILLICIHIIISK